MKFTKIIIFKVMHLLVAIGLPMFIISNKYGLFSDTDWKLNIAGTILGTALVIYGIMTAIELIKEIEDPVIKGTIVGVCLTIPFILINFLLNSVQANFEVVSYIMQVLIVSNLFGVIPLIFYYRAKNEKIENNSSE